MAQDKESQPFALLDGHNFMALTTYRKSGAPVVTPVWFAQSGETLYVRTEGNSGKAKRLRHTPRVMVGPCDARGTLLGGTVEAQARFLTPEEVPTARRAFRRKYNVQALFFEILGRVTGRRKNEVFLAITPAAATP